MKKLFTLILFSGFVIVGLAQTDQEKIDRSKEKILGKKTPPAAEETKSERSRDIILGEEEKRVYENSGIYTYGNWGNSPSEINANYHARAKEIRNNSSLSREQKKARLKELNSERKARIHQVNGKNKDRKDKDWDKKAKKSKKQKG